MQDINDAQFKVGSTPVIEEADHLSIVVEDGGLTPFELLNASGPSSNGQMLVIGKVTGAAINGGVPNLGDLVVLAQGQVPYNQSSATKWVVTIQATIRQVPRESPP